MNESKPFAIFSNDIYLGDVDFVSVDEGMGVYIGKFNPSENYADAQAIFQMYAAHLVLEDKNRGSGQGLLKEFFHARDQLNLSLRNSDGTVVSTGFIVIVDFSKVDGDEGLMAEIQISDRSFEMNNKQYVSKGE